MRILSPGESVTNNVVNQNADPTKSHRALNTFFFSIPRFNAWSIWNQPPIKTFDATPCEIHPDRGRRRRWCQRWKRICHVCYTSVHTVRRRKMFFFGIFSIIFFCFRPTQPHVRRFLAQIETRTRTKIIRNARRNRSGNLPRLFKFVFSNTPSGPQTESNWKRSCWINRRCSVNRPRLKSRCALVGESACIRKAHAFIRFCKTSLFVANPFHFWYLNICKLIENLMLLAHHFHLHQNSSNHQNHAIIAAEYCHSLNSFYSPNLLRHFFHSNARNFSEAEKHFHQSTVFDYWW